MSRLTTLRAALALSVFSLPAFTADTTELSQLIDFPKGRQVIGARDGWASMSTTSRSAGRSTPAFAARASRPIRSASARSQAVRRPGTPAR